MTIAASRITELKAIELEETSKEDLEELTNYGRTDVVPRLRELKVDERLEYSNKLDEVWKAHRSEIVELLTKSAGVSKAMVERGFDQTSDIFKNVGQMFDTLHTSGRYFLDNGAKHKVVVNGEEKEYEVRAEPRGLVGNIVATNAFPMPIWINVKGAFTGNFMTNRISSRETATIPVLKFCMHEADPRSPLAEAVQFVYIPRENTALMQEYINSQDALTVTGDRGTITTFREYAAKNPNHMFNLIEFPPRKGFEYILVPESEVECVDLANRMAMDLFEWDQYACSSPHAVVIQGNGKISGEEFTLKYYLPALRNLSKEMPSGVDIDLRKDIHRTYVANQGTFNGFRILPTFREEADFRLMYKNVGDKVPRIDEGVTLPKKMLPLGRNQFVFEVNDLEAVVKTDPNITREAQTVGLEVPENKRNDFIDTLFRRGVDRVVHIGDAGTHYMNAPHDGMMPVTKFIRYVSNERLVARQVS